MVTVCQNCLLCSDGPVEPCPDHDARLAAEQRAQALIDSQLVAASWEVQDKNDVNLFAAESVAVRGAVMAAVFEPEPKRFFPP